MEPEESNMLPQKKDRTHFLLTVTFISLFVGMAGLIIGLRSMSTEQTLFQVQNPNQYGVRDSQTTATPSRSETRGTGEEGSAGSSFQGEDGIMYIEEIDLEIPVPVIEEEVEEVEVEQQTEEVTDTDSAVDESSEPEPYEYNPTELPG